MDINGDGSPNLPPLRMTNKNFSNPKCRPFRTKFELSTRASDDDLLDSSKMRQKTHLGTDNFPQISAGK
jgi:hypothetical protein